MINASTTIRFDDPTPEAVPPPGVAVPSLKWRHVPKTYGPGQPLLFDLAGPFASGGGGINSTASNNPVLQVVATDGTIQSGGTIVDPAYRTEILQFSGSDAVKTEWPIGIAGSRDVLFAPMLADTDPVTGLSQSGETPPQITFWWDTWTSELRCSHPVWTAARVQYKRVFKRYQFTSNAPGGAWTGFLTALLAGASDTIDVPQVEGTEYTRRQLLYRVVSDYAVTEFGQWELPPGGIDDPTYPGLEDELPLPAIPTQVTHEAGFLRLSGIVLRDPGGPVRHLRPYIDDPEYERAVRIEWESPPTDDPIWERLFAEVDKVAIQDAVRARFPSLVV